MKALALSLVLAAAVDGGSEIVVFKYERLQISEPASIMAFNRKTAERTAVVNQDGGCDVSLDGGALRHEESTLCDALYRSFR